MIVSWLPSYPTSSQPILLQLPRSIFPNVMVLPFSSLFSFCFHWFSSLLHFLELTFPLWEGSSLFIFLSFFYLSCDNLTHLRRWLTCMPWPSSSYLLLLPVDSLQVPQTDPTNKLTPQALHTVFLTSQNCTPPHPPFTGFNTAKPSLAPPLLPTFNQ